MRIPLKIRALTQFNPEAMLKDEITSKLLRLYFAAPFYLYSKSNLLFFSLMALLSL